MLETYDCEVDVWYEHREWYLGHDKPEYRVDSSFIKLAGLWLHAKNERALLEMLSIGRESDTLNFFWHENDTHTITSQGYIWSYPGHSLCRYRTVEVMPEWTMMPGKYTRDSWAVCSDYVELINNPK